MTLPHSRRVASCPLSNMTLDGHCASPLGCAIGVFVFSFFFVRARNPEKKQRRGLALTFALMEYR